MTVTQYLGTGSVSRGRMTITRQLNTRVTTPPYLRDEHDREAVIQGIINLRESLKGVANLTWITPPSNVTVEAFVDSVSISPPRNPLGVCSHAVYLEGPRHAGTSVLQPLDRYVLHSYDRG